MKTMMAKKREGIVYSTNPEFEFNDSPAGEESTLPAVKQNLYIWLDSKGRKGKTVTLVKGFKGNTRDLENLAGEIKRHCGSGGSVKNGEIIIQGDFREKTVSFLTAKGYKTKRAGG